MKCGELVGDGESQRRNLGKILFREIGEDGVNSFASRMTQGIFVVINKSSFRMTKNGFVRDKSWTRQTLSDAWESTNWEGLCGTP